LATYYQIISFTHSVGWSFSNIKNELESISQFAL